MKVAAPAIHKAKQQNLDNFQMPTICSMVLVRDSLHLPHHFLRIKPFSNVTTQLKSINFNQLSYISFRSFRSLALRPLPNRSEHARAGAIRWTAKPCGHPLKERKPGGPAYKMKKNKRQTECARKQRKWWGASRAW